MFLRQIHDPQLAQYSYVIGCQASGQAIVIDPLRDGEPYRAVAAAAGLTLTDVAETHIHADFVSGARALAQEGSVRLHLSAEGGPDWQSEWARDLPGVNWLRDGSVFPLGGIRFETLHTPGHTPEHVCYLITDEGAGAEVPWVLLAGDFLFVGDVGRPDLLEQAGGISGSQQAGATQLYHSLQKLRRLPDHLQILPGHGAGSACGKSLGAVPFSTLGYEKQCNRALQLALHGTEDAFVSFILEGQPEPPLYFARMKELNQHGPAWLPKRPVPPVRSLAEAAELLAANDAVVLDTRPDPSEFAASHLKGSLFAPAEGDFPGFAGSYLQPDDRILLLAESPQAAERLARQLYLIGFDHVIGWLPAAALADMDPAWLASVPRITFRELEALLAAEPDALVLDVRKASEFAAGHLRGAVHIPHTRLRDRAHELAGGNPVIVHCQSGKRAAVALAWLQREGRNVVHVDDSFEEAPAALLADT